MITHRLLLRRGPARRLLASGVTRDVDDVGHHGACRRIPARAGPAERHFADHVAHHGDRIADAARRREDLPRRHKMRADEAAELPVLPHRAAQQLDLHAARRRKRRVRRRHLRDALDVDVRRVNVLPERQPREDARLARRVDALDVRRRVGLGIALFLRRAERRVIALAVFQHLRQDVVRRSVQNAAHRCDVVRAEAARQRVQNRDPTADRRLEQQIHAVFPRQLEQLHAMLRDQLLVRRDHVLPGPERPPHHVQRCAASADRLHDQPDLRVALDHVKVLHDLVRTRAIRHGPPRHGIFQANFLARARRDRVRVFHQDLRHAAANGAGAENCDLFHRFVLTCSPSDRSSACPQSPIPGTCRSSGLYSGCTAARGRSVRPHPVPRRTAPRSAPASPAA